MAERGTRLGLNEAQQRHPPQQEGIVLWALHRLEGVGPDLGQDVFLEAVPDGDVALFGLPPPEGRRGHVLDDGVHEIAATRGESLCAVELVVQLRGGDVSTEKRKSLSIAPSSLWKARSNLHSGPAHSARNFCRGVRVGGATGGRT
jgi:hypothetical protein